MKNIDSILAALASTLPLSLVVVAATGCTDAVTSDQDPEPDPGDVTAPMVVSTTPTASATGIAAGAKIEVTFSERMDPATIEAAYSSQKLPLDKVSMSWSPDGTVLTISPDQALLYAEGTGTDPSTVTPIAYAISIGADATDLAGNPLEAPLQLTFSTKRRMFTALTIAPGLSRTTLGGTALLESVDVIVGDSVIGNSPYRGYVSFDLAALPDGIEVESASFSARQIAVEGTPYALGPLNAYHLTFSAMTNVGAVAPISFPGVFSQDGVAESKSIEVTPQVIDDVANRGERGDLSQYRLQFDTTTDGDNLYDRTTFAKGTFEMSVLYIAD